LIGIESRDDAAVLKLDEEKALIQTIDFFTPMVDDPFIFGQIAATNALNDIYAMGGTPLLALNVVCFPECADLQVLRSILEGGLSKVLEAGALLVGGHTVDDNEPKYGLAVSGLVHPQKIIANNGAQPGDLLFLTKPLGNGVIATSIKAEMVSDQAYKEAIKWMSMLNRESSQAMIEVGVNAATDITGFGLMGHLYEMAWGSNVQVEVFAEQIPCMEGTLEYAGLGLIPGGAYNNRDYLKDKVEYAGDIDPLIRDLLFSPETAGGLLIAVEEKKAGELLRVMEKKGSFCNLIGKVQGEHFSPIRVRDRRQVP
jgi:selenide,water dikinase